MDKGHQIYSRHDNLHARTVLIQGLRDVFIYPVSLLQVYGVEHVHLGKEWDHEVLDMNFCRIQTFGHRRVSSIRHGGLVSSSCKASD